MPSNLARTCRAVAVKAAINLLAAQILPSSRSLVSSCSFHASHAPHSSRRFGQHVDKNAARPLAEHGQDTAVYGARNGKKQNFGRRCTSNKSARLSAGTPEILTSPRGVLILFWGVFSVVSHKRKAYVLLVPCISPCSLTDILQQGFQLLRLHCIACFR